jgi:predicted transposase/invertase (TIGR01784 family)
MMRCPPGQHILRLNWRDYIDRPNPVAAALMSKMKIAKGDRPKVKAECLRLLVTLRLDPGKMRMISKFVDTYLRLNQQEEATFQTELDKMNIVQKEEIMEVTTSWKEKGFEKGIEKGRQESLQTVALKMLSENLDLETIARFTGVTIEQLKSLQAESAQ